MKRQIVSDNCQTMSVVSYAAIIASIALWPPVRSYPSGAPNCAAQPGHNRDNWFEGNYLVSLQTSGLAVDQDDTLIVTVGVPTTVPVRGILLMAVSDSPQSLSGILSVYFF